MNGYRISLRYKLALPVSVFVFLMLILLTHTTIRVVRDFVVEAFQGQISIQVEDFTKAIRSSFLFRNYTYLQFHLDAVASRPEVYGVEVVDREGLPILQAPIFRKLPVLKNHISGTHALFPGQSLLSILFQPERISSEGGQGEFPDLFVAASPIFREGKELGNVQIFYTAHNVHDQIRRIYRKRIFFSFLGAMVMALLTSTVTWLAIRPLFRLRVTVLDILKGRMGVRAKIHSGDEIEDLAGAFNEMLNRLEHSLRNLQLRTEALEESEERYRALVENASDVIWLLSPAGQIIFLNQAFEGLRREDLLKEGLPLFLSFHTDESILHFNTALNQVKKEKVPVDHVATVFHHPQSRRQIYYSTNLTPVFTHGRELKAIQAVSRDVTELKRIEVMKERLIRDVAHELKTPVAKFQMTLNWLDQEFQKEKAGERYKELVGLMKRNADLLMSMIAEVMNLSRLEAGTEPLARKPCDLGQILSQVCEDMDPLIQEKKLSLEKRLDGQSIPFEGDAAMLYRLFTNLVVNALKFTPQGRIVVEAQKNKKEVRIRVSDTGVGLEKGDLEKVFDRFYQKSAATPGMGIGLALAREIAVLHGGRIWAESEGPGKGSRFIVEFPL